MSRSSSGGRRFVGDRSGQAEVLGVVLLLGIVVVGTGAIVVYGSTAVDDTGQSAAVQRAEHTMTLLDSRAAMTALGNTDTQMVSFSTDDATLDTEDDGWIRVVHHNYTAERPAKTETIYNRTLGSLVYENGGTTIAYQGGGVWRRDGNRTEMVSPPEFQYRSATLTLPVIRVTGNDSASGNVQARLTDPDETRRVFPNETAATPGTNETGSPYDETDVPYRNPVSNGTVTVTVHSDYYTAWADYFRYRTEGNVTVDHDNQTASVLLKTVGVVGFMPHLPPEGNPIEARGVGYDHPVTNFSLVLRDDQTSNGFKKSAFSLTAEKGSQKFQMMVYSDSKQRCGGGLEPLKVYVYYENATAHHEWQNTSVDPTSGAIQVQCKDYTGNWKDEPQLVVDFTGDTVMHYDEVSTVNGNNNGDHPSTDAWAFDVTTDADDPGIFAGHAGISPSEPQSYAQGTDTASIDYVMNHYMSLLGPNVDLVVNEYAPGNSERIVEYDSFGTLDYVRRPGASFLTFLHVTENELRVELE
jgi:hypothetical protein